MEEESRKRTAHSPALSEGTLPEGAKDSATDFYWPELNYNLHEEEGSCLSLLGSGSCSCREKWIGYQCSCYFLSSESKTWKDSRNFCVSQNSSLLQIQDRNELHFMKFISYYYWIGLSYSEEHHAWLWEDNSTVSQDLFPSFHRLNPKNCIIYGRSGKVLDTDCGSQHRYVCKQQLI
nr:natural killer cells antigen CD94-like [Globicephala melas]